MHEKVTQSILYAAHISGKMVVFSVIDAVLIVETGCAYIEYVIQAADAICWHLEFVHLSSFSLSRCYVNLARNFLIIS